jgi:hypothetical protein
MSPCICGTGPGIGARAGDLDRDGSRGPVDVDRHRADVPHAHRHCTSMQPAATRRNAAQHVATGCNAVQHVATGCNAVQHVATRTMHSALQHATHSMRHARGAKGTHPGLLTLLVDAACSSNSHDASPCMRREAFGLSAIIQRAPRSFCSMQRSQLHATQQRNSQRTARNARQAACRTREGTVVCTHRGPSMHRGTEALFGGSTARVRAPPAQRPYIICMTPSIGYDIYRYRYRYKNDKDADINMKKI